MSVARKLFASAAVVVVASQLQGCFPLAATGMIAGASIIADRRSNGAMLDDESIENALLVEAKRQYGDGTHLNITSYNRNVLLSGEVFNEDQKKGVEGVVRNHKSVNRIYNELAVLPVASLASVSADSATTAKVKARLVDAKGVSANNIKVVTERSTVFLMGIVSRAEAEIATETARTTSGVQRVVRLFEYNDGGAIPAPVSSPPNAPQPPMAPQGTPLPPRS